MTDAPHHRAPVKDPIARRLREARDAPMERSQSEWAKLLGVTKALVSHWETGRARPSYETAARISEISGISCDHLIAGRPGPTMARFLALPQALREWVMLQLMVAEEAYRRMPFAYEQRVPQARYEAFERHLRGIEAELGNHPDAIKAALEESRSQLRPRKK